MLLVSTFEGNMSFIKFLFMAHNVKFLSFFFVDILGFDLETKLYLGATNKSRVMTNL